MQVKTQICYRQNFKTYIVFAHSHCRWGNFTVPLHMFICVINYLISVFPDKFHVRNIIFTVIFPVHKMLSRGTELFDEWWINKWMNNGGIHKLMKACERNSTLYFWYTCLNVTGLQWWLRTWRRLWQHCLLYQSVRKWLRYQAPENSHSVLKTTCPHGAPSQTEWDSWDPARKNAIGVATFSCFCFSTLFFYNPLLREN